MKRITPAVICSLLLSLFVVAPSFAASSDTCKQYVEATIDDGSSTGILGGSNSIELRKGYMDETYGQSNESGSYGSIDSTDNLVSVTCWYHAWNNDSDPFIGNLSGDNYWNHNGLQPQDSGFYTQNGSFERYSTIVSLCHEDGSVKNFEVSGVWLNDLERSNLQNGMGTGSNYNSNWSATQTLGDGSTFYTGKSVWNCNTAMGYIRDSSSSYLPVTNADKLTQMSGSGGTGDNACAGFFEGGLEDDNGGDYSAVQKGTDTVVCTAFDPDKIKIGADVVFAVSGTSIAMDGDDIVITVGVSNLGGGEPNDPSGIKIVDDASNVGPNGEGRSRIATASTIQYEYYSLTKNKTNDPPYPNYQKVSDGNMFYNEVPVRIKNSENGSAMTKAKGANPSYGENYIELTICPADWEKGDSYEKCLYIDTNGVMSAFILPELMDLELYEDDEVEPKCTDNGHGWSWFACAATKEINEQIKDLYGFVLGYLNFDPEIYKSQSGLHDAWDTARMISNGVLAVLLLVVILSQISGIGIDNYGIKKMLPRLIVVVVLVNLSFILFRAAVDIVNILGNAISSTFESLTYGITARPPKGDSSAFNGVDALFTGTTAILVAIAGFFSMIAFLKSGESLVVLALAAAIVVIVAVLMMYLIIVLRQALLIVLSVTAPIMLLFYLVPAGNPTFKKWLNLVKGLLIAYPLCSLVVGGGDFAARIIVAVMGASAPSSSVFGSMSFNPFAYIIAIAANIGPIFFLPNMIIKSTGKLGAMVKGAADKLGRSLSGGMKGMDFAKQLKHGAEARANRVNAGVNRNGERAWWGGVTRSRNATRRMAAEEAASKDRAERRDAQFMADNPEAAMFEQNVKEEMQALEDEGIDLSSEAAITRALNDRVSDVESAQGRATIEAIARSAASSRTLGNKKAPVDTAIMKFLNDSGASKDAKAAVARARIKRSGNNMLAKSPSDYIRYQDLIAGKDVKFGDQSYDDSVMQRVIHSDHFSGGALAGYAGPEVEQLANFYSRASAADQDIIRTAYDNRGDKRANDSDTDTFEPLRRVIGH